jgi:hypothetical protein
VILLLELNNAVDGIQHSWGRPYESRGLELATFEIDDWDQPTVAAVAAIGVEDAVDAVVVGVADVVVDAAGAVVAASFAAAAATAEKVQED